MKKAFLLAGLCLSGALFAQTPPPPPGPQMPNAHIHLSTDDLQGMAKPNQPAGSSSSAAALAVGQPVPSYTTMAAAAKAGVHPFEVPVKGGKVAQPSSKFVLPEWSFYVAIGVVLLGVLYAWFRSNRRED